MPFSKENWSFEKFFFLSTKLTVIFFLCVFVSVRKIIISLFECYGNKAVLFFSLSKRPIAFGFTLAWLFFVFFF